MFYQLFPLDLEVKLISMPDWCLISQGGGEKREKTMPFLLGDVTSTFGSYVDGEGCHCVLVSFRMSCWGGVCGGDEGT